VRWWAAPDLAQLFLTCQDSGEEGSHAMSRRIRALRFPRRLTHGGQRQYRGLWPPATPLIMAFGMFAQVMERSKPVLRS
jgi:hypothetical protein